MLWHAYQFNRFLFQAEVHTYKQSQYKVNEPIRHAPDEVLQITTRPLNGTNGI